MRCRAIWALRAALIGVLASSAAGTIRAQPAEEKLLEKINTDWMERQQRIERVRYRVSGEILIPRESITDEGERPIKTVGDPTITAPFRWTYLLDFRTNRHRLEEEENSFLVGENKLSKFTITTTFDGKQRWGAAQAEPGTTRAATDPDISVSSGDLSNDRIEPSRFPMFYGHGIVPYAGRGHLYPGHLSLKPDTETVTVHGEAVQDGRRCVVLRTHPVQGTSTTFDELWVDMDRGSAIVRHARFIGKLPRTDLVITYKETTHGWLPSRWEQTVRAGNKVLEMKRAHVEELEINPLVTDSEFRLEERPGMLVAVAEQVKPAEAASVRLFRVDDRGKRREVHFENGTEKSIRRLNGIWWGVSAAIGIAISVGLVYRFRRRLYPPSLPKATGKRKA